MTDEQEYYLTYPDPNFVYETETCDSEDSVLIVNKDKVPLIILFGWKGAQDKYLKHYSKIYEDKGLITFRHICPTWVMFWQPEKMTGIAEDILKVLSELELEKRPIIIHIFSNGGSFQYEYFIKTLKQESNNTQVKGIIFDSAPGELTFSSLLKSTQFSRGGNTRFLNLPISFLITASQFVADYLKIFRGFIFIKYVHQFNPFGNLKNEENICPQHFIYSKSDQLVLYKDVEKFMDHRKSLGVDVSSKLYENTPHVRHYPSNKLSYTRSIFKFVNKCLRKYMLILFSLNKHLFTYSNRISKIIEDTMLSTNSSK